MHLDAYGVSNLSVKLEVVLWWQFVSAWFGELKQEAVLCAACLPEEAVPTGIVED